MASVPGDFTFFRECEDQGGVAELCDRVPNGRGEAQREPRSKAEHFSRACIARLGMSGAEGAAELVPYAGRALVCRSFGGRYLSATCRRLDEAS